MKRRARRSVIRRAVPRIDGRRDDETTGRRDDGTTRRRDDETSARRAKGIMRTRSSARGARIRADAREVDSGGVSTRRGRRGWPRRACGGEWDAGRARRRCRAMVTMVSPRSPTWWRSRLGTQTNSLRGDSSSRRRWCAIWRRTSGTGEAVAREMDANHHLSS